MTLGEFARKRLSFLAVLVALMAIVSVSQPSVAAPATAAVATPSPQATAPNTPPPADLAGETGAVPQGADAPGYTPLGPEWIKGQPHQGDLNIQPQYSTIGDTAVPLHVGLIWVMAIISAVVLFLLLYVMIRFRKGANPVPSKTSHNTLIEIIWTVVPVIVLVVIAVPSIILLRDQFKAPPEDALTVKVTGYQWYWGYTYPDNGDFEVISNMMPEEEAKAKGFPGHLEVDNRMVVPVGEWLRIQTIGADVIHSFAVPSLWYKLDAVPGRLNEKKLFIKEPGIYYGQCSELCGARHGYMPIAVEAVPRAQFDAWVRAQGGTVGGDEPGIPAEGQTPQAPASAVEDAPAAGANPAEPQPAA